MCINLKPTLEMSPWSSVEAWAAEDLPRELSDLYESQFLAFKQIALTKF
jgi:hypothetical protein